MSVLTAGLDTILPPALFEIPVASRSEIAAGYVVPVDPSIETECEGCS